MIENMMTQSHSDASYSPDQIMIWMICAIIGLKTHINDNFIIPIIFF